MKKLKNPKILMALIAAIVVLGGVGVVVVKSMMTVDYKRQYTQEEWNALSPKEKERIFKARVCAPDRELDFLGFKCDE